MKYQINNYMDTKIINFIGAPSVGKSLMASLIFSELKMRHLKAEYVQEHAKMLIYQELFEELNNQHSVSMNQYKMLKSINGKVNYICTDSPLLLGLYYNRAYKTNICNVEKLEKLLLQKIDEFNNIYIFLKRNDSFPYEIEGRVHNENESKQIEKELELLLQEFKIPYITVVSDRLSVNRILDEII